MKLTQEDMTLLRENPTAFLVKAYLCSDNTPSTRECAELLGLSHSTCFRLMKRFGFGKHETKGETAGETKKTTKTKTSKAAAETPNETPNETPRHPAKPAPLTHYKEVFNQYYRQLSNGIDFYWSAKEVKALDMLTKKIAAGMKEKGLNTTEETLSHSLRLLLSIISDPWILDNFTPSIINSKYNAIITTYHRNKGRASQRGASKQQAELDAFKRAIAAKRREMGG